MSRNSWLTQGLSSLSSNIRNQLTEFTAEILHDDYAQNNASSSAPATDEEGLFQLQVQLTARIQEVEQLKQRNTELIEQLAEVKRHISGGSLHEDEVSSDGEFGIRVSGGKFGDLQNFTPSFNIAGKRLADDGCEFAAGEDGGAFSPTSTQFEIRKLNDEIRQLQEECQHWKNLSKISSCPNETDKDKQITELKAEITRLNEEVGSLRKAMHSNGHTSRSSVSDLAEIRSETEDSNEWNDDTWDESAWPTSTDKEEERPAETEDRVEQHKVDGEESFKNDELANLKEELKRLQCDRDASLEELDREHQTVVDRLLQDRTELKTLCEKQKDELASQEARVVELEECTKQLQLENTELVSAYNELNEQYEKHRAESSDVTTSNRELEGRLEALKNDLFEYEEKYERCKAENQLAMQQLENLSNEFGRLKAEWLKSSMNSDLRNWQGEVIKLSRELEESLQKRHELVSSISEYEDLACSFQKHIEKLKAENERLRRVTAEQQQELEQFDDVRSCLDELRSEMGGLLSVLHRYDESYASRYENLLKHFTSLIETKAKSKEKSPTSYASVELAIEEEADEVPLDRHKQSDVSMSPEHKQAIEDLNGTNQELAKKLKDSEDVCSYQDTVIAVLRQNAEMQFWENYGLLRVLHLYRNYVGPEVVRKLETLQLQPNFALKAIAYEEQHGNDEDQRAEAVAGADVIPVPRFPLTSPWSYARAFGRSRSMSDSVVLCCHVPHYVSPLTEGVSGGGYGGHAKSIEITEVDDGSPTSSCSGRRKGATVARKRFIKASMLKLRQVTMERSALKAAVERLTRKAESHLKRITQLNVENARLTELSESLKARLADEGLRCEALAKNADAMHAFQGRLEESLGAKEAALSEAQAMVASLTTQLTAMQTETSDKNHEQALVEETKQQLTTLSSQLEEKSRQLEATTRQLADAEHRCETLTKTVNTVRTADQQLKEALNVKEHVLSETQAKVTSLVAQLTALQTETHQNEQDLVIMGQMQQQLAMARSEFEQKSRELDATVKQLADAERRYEALAKKVDTMQTIQQRLEEALGVKETTLGETQTKIISLMAQLTAAQTEISRKEQDQALMAQTQQQLMTTRSNFEEKNRELEEVSKQLADAEGAVQRLEAQLAAAVMEKNRIEAELQNHQMELVDIKSRFEETHHGLQSCTRTVEALKTENAALRHSRGLLSDRLSDTRAKLLVLKQEFEQQKQEVVLALAGFSADMRKFGNRFQAYGQSLTFDRQQLVALVSSKHEECVRYHHEWQRVTDLLRQEKTRVQEMIQKRGRRSMSDASTESEAEKDEERARKVDILSQQLQQANAAVVQRDQLLTSLNSQVDDIKERCRRDLVSMLEERDRLSTEVTAVKQRETNLAEQMRILQEAKARSDGEVKRLKDHLISMEETCTQDAVKSEEREISLRERVRELETQLSQTAETSQLHNKQLLGQIEKLQADLRVVMIERDAIQNQLATTKLNLDNSQKALATLRNTLEHFQDEKKLQFAKNMEDCSKRVEALAVLNEQNSRKIDELTNELQQKERVIDGFRQEKERLATQSHSSDELARKLSEEERRIMEYEKKLTKMKCSLENKLDKDILKNLFLGYFCAPSDKKLEVAHLLGSVLGFDDDQFKKIQGESSGSSGWLQYFIGGRNPPSSEHSIVAEFVRFLETESRPKPADRPIVPSGGGAADTGSSFSRSSTPPSSISGFQCPLAEATSGLDNRRASGGSPFPPQTTATADSRTSSTSNFLRELLGTDNPKDER